MEVVVVWSCVRLALSLCCDTVKLAFLDKVSVWCWQRGEGRVEPVHNVVQLGLWCGAAVEWESSETRLNSTNTNTHTYPSLVCINGGVDAFGDAAHTRECLLEWLVVCMVLWRPLEQCLEQQAIARYVLHRPDHEALDGLACRACAHGLCGCELAKGLVASL